METTLEQLYEMQKVLDAAIIEKKGLQGQDLLPNTVLALQVELGELANEWRGFKHWSNDQLPREVEIVIEGETCEDEIVRYPLLEEYVDCLHFFLSIALQLDLPVDRLLDPKPDGEVYPCGETVEVFSGIITAIGLVDVDETAFDDAWVAFGELGDRLGFTWEQTAAAYCAKNKTNHDRQVNGY